MKEIQGEAKTIRQLLGGAKYAIDYYQREYRWTEKQIQELLDDLTDVFKEHHELSDDRSEVANYGRYFLGSIIISHKGGQNFIIDGQQRLTSLTLLLIYMHNLQRDTEDQVHIEELIFSKKYGKKSFNLDVEERSPCMDALFNGSSYDATGRPESVQNMVARYEDIRVHFPEELTTNSLPFFVDWLIENVYLVEITAFSDEDAYTIFETMNDRGLSLSPSDMLKGYLLANITDEAEKTRANKLWKERLQTLTEVGKETDADSFKAWLRSQYADTIRERKKGASAGDYDRIGTEYHRWVRERRERLGLGGSADYARFINWDFDFYSRQYLRLLEASRRLVPGLEPIFYNAQLGFTLQHPVLLASLVPGDDDETIRLKLQLTSTFIDIVLNRRIWNYRSISYSTMQYNMFLVIRDIRRARPSDLATKLSERLEVDGETFASNSRFALHQQNRKYVHSILARITDYIEQASGMSPRYLEYIGGEGAQRYEVEHIWANKPERHAQDFPHPIDFGDYRNRIGGLLLLPKSFNASYGALEYHQKLPHYLTQNLLARSLHPQSYEHNPGFTRFVEASGLNFGPHNVFNKEDLDARGKLYCSLAERVWNPQRIHRAVLALGTR